MKEVTQEKKYTTKRLKNSNQLINDVGISMKKMVAN